MKWMDRFKNAGKTGARAKLESVGLSEGIVPGLNHNLPEPAKAAAHAADMDITPGPSGAPPPIAAEIIAADDGSILSGLSPRETEVFKRLLTGAKMKEIAGELGVKTSTVNGYCRQVYKQLGVNSKAQLILQYSGYWKNT